MPTDPSRWVHALRRSHDRVATVTAGLDAAGLRLPSYCRDWSIAQVLSHLGSQVEIFSLFVDVGLSGAEPPGPEAFGPIWDGWNARSPDAQAADSIAANEEFVRRLEGLDAEQLRTLHLTLFGAEVDAAGLFRMRLSEHAVHAWDIAVAVDPGATVDGAAVELLIEGLGEMAARLGRPAARPATLTVSTSDPARRFALVTGGVRLEPWRGQPDDGSLQLPAEALIRLVYGRLDAAHTPTLHLDAPGIRLDDLRAVFPGF